MYVYAERAICYRPSVCPSGCPFVTRSKTVEVRIMQLSPQSSQIPLVFAFNPEILTEASNKGGENVLFSSFMRRYLKNVAYALSIGIKIDDLGWL